MVRIDPRGRTYTALITVFTLITILFQGSISAANAIGSCSALSLINGDFEANLPGSTPNGGYYVGEYFDAGVTSVYVSGGGWSIYAVPGIGWNTTESDSLIEFWNGNPQDTSPWVVQAYDGNQFVELNANQPSGLYQDIATTPGQKVQWKLAHRGRLGVDVMRVLIGNALNENAQTQSERFPGTETPTSLIQQGSPISDGTSKWGVYSGVYKVPADQTVTRFQFEAVTSIGGDSWGNFLDGISFAPADCLSKTPTYDPPSITGTSDGFTVQLTNYLASSMSVATDTGTVSVSSNGLITVSEVATGTAAVVSVNNQEPGMLPASVTITANSLGSPKIPQFGGVTTANGAIIAQIANFDPSFTWNASASDTTSVTIDGTGFITLTDIANREIFLTVTTSKSGYVGGNNSIQLNFLVEQEQLVLEEPAPPSIPDPRQTDSITAFSLAHFGSNFANSFTITGVFNLVPCSIRNISVNGVNIDVDSWQATKESITFSLPPLVADNFTVQVFNGCGPMLPEISYSYATEIENSFKLLNGLSHK